MRESIAVATLPSKTAEPCRQEMLQSKEIAKMGFKVCHYAYIVTVIRVILVNGRSADGICKVYVGHNALQ